MDERIKGATDGRMDGWTDGQREGEGRMLLLQLLLVVLVRNNRRKTLPENVTTAVSGWRGLTKMIDKWGAQVH